METAPLDASFYKQALIVLAAAGVVIPLFHRLHISAVLGFMLESDCARDLAVSRTMTWRTSNVTPVRRRSISRCSVRMRRTPAPTTVGLNLVSAPAALDLVQTCATDAQHVYLPANGISGNPYGTLMGRPVIPVEYADTLGTVGDITLCDYSQYMLADKGATVICIAGGGSPDRPLREAIDYANTKGVPVVGSIGNLDRGEPVYPGADNDAIGSMAERGA